MNRAFENNRFAWQRCHRALHKCRALLRQRILREQRPDIFDFVFVSGNSPHRPCVAHIHGDAEGSATFQVVPCALQQFIERCGCANPQQLIGGNASGKNAGSCGILFKTDAVSRQLMTAVRDLRISSTESGSFRIVKRPRHYFPRIPPVVAAHRCDSLRRHTFLQRDPA
jgi:hypothetical protein